ncbi:major facilitator superfamily MFS_1 [Actinobacteria bacterium OK074]|nr:major facilitator superfamily MFS_1 [Actinobacteria bacterium OK074]
MTYGTRHRRLTLALSVAGAVVVALDGTVLTVAQPALRRDLHASFAAVQWTSTGYLIAVAGLLVFAGRLGDRYGHQRVFALGALGFGVASAGIGAAPGVGWVTGLRVVQGVFGALLQPATLGMLRDAYPADRLGPPIALRTSAIGVAAAAGPLVGGALVTAFGWRTVFLLNIVPTFAMALLAMVVGVPGRPRTGRRPDTALDLPGAALLALALVALVHTLVGVPAPGWTPAAVLGPAVAVLAGTAFVRRERRVPAPLLPPGLLAVPGVGAALGVLVAASGAMLGALFVSSYRLQDVLGLDPWQTALHALPGPLAMIATAPLIPPLTRRQGPRRTTTAALALLAAGVLALAVPTASPMWTGTGFLLLGIGFSTVMVTATAVVVREIPAESAGLAGGLQQTAMNIGPVLGVAVASTMLTYTGTTTGATPGALAALVAVGVPLARRLPDPDRAGSGKAAPSGHTRITEGRAHGPQP